MDVRQLITRRRFLTVSASAAVALLAACQQPQVVEKIVKETVEVAKEVEKIVKETVVVEKEKVVEVSKVSTRQAPMLQERVKAGELPPLEERLPLEPLVVHPYGEIGEYGGTIRVGSDSTGLYGGDSDLYAQPQNMLRIKPDLTGAVPNVLKAWEMSDDFTEITCFMRAGMKWSDGEPFTADDFMFWYEDILLNEELRPVVPQWFRPGGEPMLCEKLDDYTFKLKFAIPTPSFVMINMAHKYGFWSRTFEPAHYLKQYHIKYNPKAEDLAKDAGFDFWHQYFGNRSDPNQNIDRPNLRAMIPVKDTPEMVFLERNPYFWMVDPEGNQLPYIDKMVHNRVADRSMLDAKVVGGQYDFCGFNTSIENYSTYADAAEQGNYQILLWKSGKGSDVMYQFNLNWNMEEGVPTSEQKPDMWREVFSDVRFRRAMSLAINRDEINEVIYFGHATPGQMTVIPASHSYKPEYAEAWADYDPVQANALLDEIGLKWDEDHKHRLWPDGTPIKIAWDIYESETPKAPITELVVEYWMNVGIEVPYKSITRDLLTQKILANEEPISLWHGDETTDVLFMSRPKFFAPIDGDEGCFGVLWGRWYNTQGEGGVEPPQEIKDLYDWLDKYLETRELEWTHKTLESQAENLWSIGTVGNAPHPLMFSNDLGNLTEDGYWVWDSLWTWPVYPEQWYFKQG